jgi:hypothetical protein
METLPSCFSLDAFKSCLMFSTPFNALNDRTLLRLFEPSRVRRCSMLLDT